MKIHHAIPSRLRGFLALATVSLALPATGFAQSVQSLQDTSASRPPAVFTGRDALTVAAFAIATAAVMPLDRHIAIESQRPSLQNNSALSHTLTGFRVLGEPGSIALAGAAYLYGRTADSPRSAELGLRTIESIGAAGITSLIIKGLAGRARPFVVADTNPHDYKPGRGFRSDDYTSFPSGHVTTAFAAASAASQEIAYLWPHASHLWTPLLFTSASIVGVARVYEDKHWASDVVAGAAVGTIVSRMVVRFSRAHPGNAIDRILLPNGVGPAAAGRGVAFNWNYQW
ncbi:MAG: phosphatase PAP2 family protein [Gemmatimonadota bacterium]|nr:phosphatase PAP2 family protein [Gemmatimonadota bacterium]